MRKNDNEEFDAQKIIEFAIGGKKKENKKEAPDFFDRFRATIYKTDNDEICFETESDKELSFWEKVPTYAMLTAALARDFGADMEKEMCNKHCLEEGDTPCTTDVERFVCALSNVMSNEEYAIKEAFVFTTENIEIHDRNVYLPVYMLMYLRPKEMANPIFVFQPI